MQNTIVYFSLVLILTAFSLSAQERDSNLVDPSAIALLDRMSILIGELEAASFELNTSQDIQHGEYGMITRHGTHKVYLKGPDKMQVTSKVSGKTTSIWSAGQGIWYYVFDENNYSFLPLEGNLIEVFDGLYFQYGVEMPAADIFYPAFTDDILQAYDELRLVGMTEIDGKKCFQILARSEHEVMQIWLRNDAFFLPVKMMIRSQENEQVRIYEAEFEQWSINPQLPDSMFIFNPPANASKILMLSKD